MKYVKILVAVSFVFLVVYLFRQEEFTFPRIAHVPSFSFSLVLLFASFIIQGANWKSVLKREYPISWKHALASTGLSVFAKYIPGKILVIIGRSQYIRAKYDYSNEGLILRSLDTQLLVIWTGFLLSVPALIHLEKFQAWWSVLVLLFVILTIFIFTPVLHAATRKTVLLITGKKIDIPTIHFKSAIRVLPVFVLYWVVLGVSFYFLLVSLYGPVPLITGLIFPLAATLGIVVFIAPGGLGVREGILTALLHAGGLPLPEATAVAIFSRLWFLIGEGFLFLVGWVAHRS